MYYVRSRVVTDRQTDRLSTVTLVRMRRALMKRYLELKQHKLEVSSIGGWLREKMNCGRCWSLHEVAQINQFYHYGWDN